MELEITTRQLSPAQFLFGECARHCQSLYPQPLLAAGSQPAPERPATAWEGFASGLGL